MAFQAETTHANTDVKPFWKQYRLFHAAWAQFCYTGAQIAIAGQSPSNIPPHIPSISNNV